MTKVNQLYKKNLNKSAKYEYFDLKLSMYDNLVDLLSPGQI